MKQILLGVSLCFGLILLPGCQKTPPPVHVTNSKSGTASTDSLKPALDLLRQATEVAHFRDALYLLNSHLTKETGKQVTPSSPEASQALRELFQLDKEESEFVDAVLFRPIDAYHLQSCFLFRDAARLLQVDDGSPLEQARVGFEWSMRHVKLHEQSDEGLPPVFVLRRGFGSALDRAVVFLALLRQLQIEGCVLAPAADAAGPILVGVLREHKQKPQLHLFDPRLGRKIASLDHKGIATLDEARSHPELLKGSGIAADAVGKLEAFQVSPLEALPARMLFLQELLAIQDKVILHDDADAVGRELAKAVGRPALVWNAKSVKQPAPTRALRQFLNLEDGGIDKEGRYDRFQLAQMPWPGLLLQFQAMHLVQPQDFPEQAREMLLGNVRRLFTTFATEPKQFFLHGDFDAALKRVDRIRNVLDAEEAAKPLEGPAFAQQLNAWRARVQDAYIAKIVRKDPDGAAKVDSIWTEDQYLLNALQPDSEIPLTRYEKRFLSTLLFNACREPLGQQGNYLVAACLHEKAAQLQANEDIRAGKGKDVTIVKENAGYAWGNARADWVKYLGRYELNSQSLARRLSAIQRRWNQGDVAIALFLWEQLHLDMHTSFEARLRLAEAQARTLKSSPALKELLADIDSFQKSTLPKQLNECLEKARGTPIAQRLELLARDWADDGNIHWVRENVRGRMDKAP